MESEGSERASINSVKWKSAIYVCMYSVFYDMFSCASMNNLDSSTNWTFHTGWRVDLTNTADSSIAHTPWKKRKQIKEKAGTGGEARQNES